MEKKPKQKYEESRAGPVFSTRPGKSTGSKKFNSGMGYVLALGSGTRTKIRNFPEICFDLWIKHGSEPAKYAIRSTSKNCPTILFQLKNKIQKNSEEFRAGLVFWPGPENFPGSGFWFFLSWFRVILRFSGGWPDFPMVDMFLSISLFVTSFLTIGPYV